MRVQVPAVEGTPLQGQLLEVEMVALQQTVGDLRAKVADVLQMPPGKLKLHRDGVGFMVGTYSMAYYNLSPDVVVHLGLKERGGRKKQAEGT